MAEFQKVMEERQRMCNSYTICRQCRIDAIRNDVCDVWIARNPKEAEQIIMEWAAEHPTKTNRDKFKEVFGIDYLDPLPGGGSAWLTAEYKGGQDEQN